MFPHYLKWCLGLASPTTQTTEAERACVGRHAAGRRWLAEIGVWHGVTTCVMRRAMAPDGVLYAVDPYPPGRLGFSTQERIARRTVGRVANGRVEWLRMTGADAARHVADKGLGPVDFLFIDGDHTYDGLRADWEGWSPLIAPGGAVALHDSEVYAGGQPTDATGSVRYTREVVRRDPRFEAVEVVDSLTVVRRKGRA